MRPDDEVRLNHLRDAARTASVGFTSAPAWIITVLPSGPGCAGIA